MTASFALTPVGHVVSTLTDRSAAPKQGREGAPPAEIVLEPAFADAARDLAVDDEVLVVTWLHQADRDTLAVHPRDDPANPLTGVFSTRSADRPNPVGLHRARITSVDGLRIGVDALEAIDGTPVIDLKPVLSPVPQGPPRPRAQRIRDTLARLERDVDAWVASGDGEAYLVPLSFLWDGETLLLSTLETNPTGRNLAATGTVRLGIGPTRDVVLVEGSVEVLTGVPGEVGDTFAAKTGFDPRTLGGRWGWYRVRPSRIQSWREADEIAGRDVMVDGRWLDEP